MVPTSSGFVEPSGSGSDGEEDFYLHLHLPPELDLPLPATTQIYHQPPTSYLIPRWDLGPDSGAFTRIEFPPANSRPGVQEDVDTFETILAQCTAFLERASPPQPPRPSEKAKAKAREAADEQLPAYNPADYNPGEGYVQGSHSSNNGGRIVLIDEEDGSVLGELTDSYQVVEDSKIKHGSKGKFHKHHDHALQSLTATQNPLKLRFPAMVARIFLCSLSHSHGLRWICTLPIRSRLS